MARMQARYAGTCDACGGKIWKNDWIDYASGIVRHEKCVPAAEREQARQDEAQRAAAAQAARERREQEHAVAQQRAAALAERRRMLPRHLELDSNGQLWNIGNVDENRIIQELALDEDISVAAARRKVLGNIGYWVPGAARVDETETSGSYPEALDEGDVQAKRSIEEQP